MVSKEKKILIIAFVSGVLVAMLLSVFWLVIQRQELNQTKTALEALQAENQGEDDDEKPKTKVALYFIQDGQDESFLVPEVRAMSYTSTPERTAIEELIKGPSVEGLQPVLPPKTKVNGLVVENGLAVLDLSAEAMKISRGSWGEALVVWAIVNTLTKYPGVEAVQILIEGNSVETLAGHFDLSRALRRNEQVIRDEWTR